MTQASGNGGAGAVDLSGADYDTDGDLDIYRPGGAPRGSPQARLVVS